MNPFNPATQTLIWLLLAQAAALLIWGATLTSRVKTLEKEIAPLKEVCLMCARMEVQLEGLHAELLRLNGSIAWMRDPAPVAPAKRDFTEMRK